MSFDEENEFYKKLIINNILGIIYYDFFIKFLFCGHSNDGTSSVDVYIYLIKSNTFRTLCTYDFWFYEATKTLFLQ